MAGLLAPQFHDEDAAREYMEKMRWPEGPVCPHCGVVNEATKLTPKPEAKTHARKGVWKCNACLKQFTVLVDSIFSDSHIPLHKWLLAIHLMCSSKKGISAHQLMRELEIGSYRTAWFMAHRIRWAMGQEPMASMLSGVVEVDSTLIGGKIRTGTPASMGGKKSGKDRSPLANKARVFSVLQRKGQVRSFHVPRVTNENIKPIVDEVVSKDAHVMTDKASALKFPANERKHSTVDHQAKEYVRHEDGLCVTTNTVESYFAILKRGNYGVFHHWGKHYTDQYLREFDFRYNCRKITDDQRAEIALRQTAGKRLTLKQPKD